MGEINLWTWGVIVVGLFFLIYIILSKNKLKKTILRRLTSGEED